MFIVEMLKRLRGKLDLFAMFPIGATMQDGGKRKEERLDCWIGQLLKKLRIYRSF